MPSDREIRRDRMLARAGFAGARIAPLAADASFRRYDRIEGRGGRRAVLMDAPPGKEDVRPFHRIAEILRGWDLSAPAVLGADAKAGYLLLEDLGDDLFSRLIEGGMAEAGLYGPAIDLLAALPGHPPPGDLPAYDLDLLLTETDIFLDWRYAEAAGHEAPDEARQAWRDAWAACLTPVARDRSVLVLRDYHVDNLIWLPEREGLRRVGLLDFQDAVRGHPAYDVASLLSDVRRDVPRALEQEMLERYLAATGFHPTAFRIAYALLAAQRNAKILGIFTRLSRRDGKHGYRRWLPRTWRLLRRDLADPALDPVARWFETWLPSDPAEDDGAT